jgi:hypothetical protein
MRKSLSPCSIRVCTREVDRADAIGLSISDLRFLRSRFARL